MAYIPAPDFKIRSVTWSLEARAAINVSAYTGQRTVSAEPWHSRWRAQVQLALTQGEDDFSELRSFITRCRGSLNTFRLYATTTPQNSNSGVSVSVAASAGATSISVTGHTTPLKAGEFFTINGQLCCCTADQSGGLSNATLYFEPALREDAVVGTQVETSEPYAIVYMAAPQLGWNIEPWRLFDFSFDVEEAILESPSLFYDTFADASGALIMERDVQHRRLLGDTYGDTPTRWHGFGPDWTTDGNGYASPTAISSAATNTLRAAALAHCGTAGDRKINVVMQGPNSGTGFIVASDGRYFVRFFITTSTIIIYEYDAHASSPTYTNSGSNWAQIGSASATITYSGTTDYEYEITVVGSLITVTHVASGISTSATTTLPVGPMIGLHATSTSVKVSSVKVHSIGEVTGYDIGNGVELADARMVDMLRDADAIDLADMNSDGRQDLLVANSTNGNNRAAGLYWYEQKAGNRYTRHTIDQNADNTTTDRFTKIEGACWVPFAGGVFAVDQTADKQYFYTPDSDLTGTWTRVELSAYAHGQDCMVVTIDGTQCILFAYEGTGSGTADTNGGIVCYRLTGSDPLNAADWTISQIVRHKGAWGFTKSARELTTLDADQVIIFNARDSGNQPDGVSGIYYVAKPASPFAGEWTETTVYAGANGEDIISCDIGDFSGDGNGLDIAFCQVTGAAGAAKAAEPQYARKASAWAVSSMGTIGLSTAHTLYNIGTMPTRGTGSRDGVYITVGKQGFYHVYWNGSAWASSIIMGARYDHPSEKSVVPRLARSDGSWSDYHANSAGQSVHELRYRDAA